MVSQRWSCPTTLEESGCDFSTFPPEKSAPGGGSYRRLVSGGDKGPCLKTAFHSFHLLKDVYWFPLFGFEGNLLLEIVAQEYVSLLVLNGIHYWTYLPKGIFPVGFNDNLRETVASGYVSCLVSKGVYHWKCRGLQKMEVSSQQIGADGLPGNWRFIVTIRHWLSCS